MPPADFLSSSRSVVRNSLFNIAGFLASAIYMIVLVPVATWFLGTEQYGLWIAVLALTGYLGLADLGLSTSFVTYIARYVALGDLRTANRVITHGLVFYLLVSLVIFVCSVVCYPLFFDLLKIQNADWEVAKLSLYLAVATFAVTSVAGVFGNALAAIQRMDAFNLQYAAFLALRLLFAVVVLKAGYGVPGLFVADLTAITLSIPVVVYLTAKCIPGIVLRWDGYDAGLMKTLVKFGTRLQVSRAAELVQMHFDKLLLARFQGFGATAMYDYGSRPINRLRSLPVTGIASLVPAVSALDARDDAARISAAVTRSTRYLILMALPLFGFCILFADRILFLWLGAGREQAAYTMRALAFGSFFAVVLSALSLASLGKGEPQFQMRTTLVQATLNIILSTVLVIKYGFPGAVAGTTISMVAGAMLFYWVYGRRVLPSPFVFLRKAIVKPFLCLLPAAAAAYAVTAGGDLLFPHMSRWAGAGFVAIAGAVFLCCYLPMLRAAAVFGADDVRFLHDALPERVVRMLFRGRGAPHDS